MAGSLALLMLGAEAQTPQAGSDTLAQQAIPDAPRPQTSIPVDGVTPGKGSSTSNMQEGTGTTSAPTPNAPAGNQPPQPTTETSTPPPPGTPPDQGPTYAPPSGKGEEAVADLTIRVPVNLVILPFTVKDNKGNLVNGLHVRDIQVFENNVPQHIAVFTNDPLPMSVALVIDQSMSKDDMERVNDALGALQGAFSGYDEISVFTYNKSVQKMTDFTGAQSPRLTQTIERSKSSGREMYLAGDLGGPTACTTCINNQNFDPNTSANRGHTTTQVDLPREVHPLNDAILAAAASLSNRPLERRHVMYVISDGKELGSKAKTSEVIKYLLTNNIELDGTLVGDSAISYIGFLDKFHLPLQMRDNALVKYRDATGGQLDAEFRLASIQKSFARVAAEARTRYTVAYYSHEPFVDGKYRKVEIRVLKPDLQVLAKGGYWPMAMAARTHTNTPAR